MLFTSENWHINLIGRIRKEISMNTKLWIRSQVCPRNLENVNEYRNDRLLASALASFVFFYKWGTQQSKDTKSLFVFQIWQQFVRDISVLVKLGSWKFIFVPESSFGDKPFYCRLAKFQGNKTNSWRGQDFFLVKYQRWIMISHAFADALTAEEPRKPYHWAVKVDASTCQPFLRVPLS